MTRSWTRRSLLRTAPVAAAAALVAALLGLAAAAPLQAQALASEKASVSQTIAGTVITIDYYRPSMRGRDSIFGRQVPWGETWTPGANYATTISVNRPIRLNGQLVPAGKYGVWIRVLRDSAWVFALHPDTTRVHTRPPQLTEMTLTFPVTPTVADGYRETLTFVFEHVRATGAQLQLWWARTLLSIDLTVESGARSAVDSATRSVRDQGPPGRVPMTPRYRAIAW